MDVTIRAYDVGLQVTGNRDRIRPDIPTWHFGGPVGLSPQLVRSVQLAFHRTVQLRRHGHDQRQRTGTHRDLSCLAESLKISRGENNGRGREWCDELAGSIETKPVKALSTRAGLTRGLEVPGEVFIGGAPTARKPHRTKITFFCKHEIADLLMECPTGATTRNVTLVHRLMDCG